MAHGILDLSNSDLGHDAERDLALEKQRSGEEIGHQQGGIGVGVDPQGQGGGHKHGDAARAQHRVQPAVRSFALPGAASEKGDGF